MAGSTEHPVKTLSLCYRTPGSRAGRRQRGPPGSGPAGGSGHGVPTQVWVFESESEPRFWVPGAGSECHSWGKRPGFGAACSFPGRGAGPPPQGVLGTVALTKYLLWSVRGETSTPWEAWSSFRVCKQQEVQSAKTTQGNRCPTWHLHWQPALSPALSTSRPRGKRAGQEGRTGVSPARMLCLCCLSAEDAPVPLGRRNGKGPHPVLPSSPDLPPRPTRDTPLLPPPPVVSRRLSRAASSLLGLPSWWTGRPHLDGCEGETLSETPGQAGPQTCALRHGRPPRPHPSSRTTLSLQIWTLHPEASRKSGSRWP